MDNNTFVASSTYIDLVTSYFNKGFLLVVADLFSLITISSCLVLKVPQINTIRRNESARGISIFGLCLELFSYTVSLSYNYSNRYEFLSYMEYPILLIQEYFLIFYVLKYENLLCRRTWIISAVYMIIIALIYLGLFPIIIITFLVPFCTPIGATSKVLQLLAILKTKDASSVSGKTWFLSAFTNFTRIYTVYVQSHDLMLLTNFIISFFLSSSVLIASCVYKGKEKKA